MQAIKTIASYVSVRSSALVAACVYGLWDVRLAGESDLLESLPESQVCLRERVENDMQLEKTTVAFNGSVIENYPGYLEGCQKYIDSLLQTKVSHKTRTIELVPAKESSLMGAAVALACIGGEA